MCIDCCQQTRHTTRRSKVTETKIAMQHRHEQRRMERKAVKDNIRKKYGLCYKNLYQKIPLHSIIRPTMEAFQFHLNNLFYYEEGKETLISVVVLEFV